MTPLESSCHDILYKNFSYTDEHVYILYDSESPLADILTSAFMHIAPENSQIREFKNPPQPLYRGGLINPDNPHIKEQNRLVTSHNILENQKVWLDHHLDPTLQSAETLDPQIDEIKAALTSLPSWSIVVLIQSTNFRLSTFRIRLELFHLGIHVLEFNHLAYIPESEFDTFQNSLIYRTDEYVRMEGILRGKIEKNNVLYLQDDISSSHYGMVRIGSIDWSYLTFWPLESIRWNTWDYSSVSNKWGTFPIGEVFTESIDLSSVHGRCLIEAFPNEDFSVCHCDPFELVIKHGRVLPSPHFPLAFQKLYDYMIAFEWEVIVRELGMGINPAITTSTPLSDINFYERKTWVHLSLGKKHGIYGKKLPKTEVQRFHIDVFIALDWVWIGEERVYEDWRWAL